MRKLLVATHGRFASGIMETFKLIMGENEDISEISAYVEPGFDMQKEAEKKIHELNEEDELIIVADIMGGSIANTFSSYIQSEKIHIITGLNKSKLNPVYLHDRNKKAIVDSIEGIKLEKGD